MKAPIASTRAAMIPRKARRRVAALDPVAMAPAYEAERCEVASGGAEGGTCAPTRPGRGFEWSVSRTSSSTPGLHAFIFINELDPGTNIRTVINDLRDVGPPPDGAVVFAAETVGSSLGFAHVRLDDPNDLRGLQDLIANEALGSRCPLRSLHREGHQQPQRQPSGGEARHPGDHRDLEAEGAAWRDPATPRRPRRPGGGPIGSTFKGSLGDLREVGRAGPTRRRGLHHGVAKRSSSDLPRFDAILHSDTLFTDGRH